jgi:hypothetical protein
MGKFGKQFTRRGAMTTKMGNVTFYKGKTARNEGVHTNKGAYVVRPERLLTIVAPDLTGFAVSRTRIAASLREGRGVPPPFWACVKFRPSA